MILQGRVGRVVADAEHFGKPDGDGADQEAADGRPGDKWHLDIAGEPVGGENGDLEDHGDRRRDDAEQHEGGNLEIGADLVRRYDECRDIAEPGLRDDGRHHRGQHERHEARHGEVTQDHLLGEQDPGNRRIERGGHGASNARGKQRAPGGIGQMEAGAGGSRNASAEMNDRALAASAGAAPERERAGEGAEQSLA